VRTEPHDVGPVGEAGHRADGALEAKVDEHQLPVAGFELGGGPHEADLGAGVRRDGREAGLVHQVGHEGHDVHGENRTTTHVPVRTSVWLPAVVLTLTGTHVELVPLRLDHVDQLVAAATEPDARYDWTTVPGDADAMATFLRWQLDRADQGSWIPFTTVRLDGGARRIVGSTSFLSIERWDPAATPTDPPDSVEVGATWLARSAQRTAVNTEAKLLMLRHAFDVWGVARVQLKTDARNEQSRAAIERLGARHEGVLRSYQAGAGRLGTGAPRNTAMYSILPEEWPAIRDRLEARLRR